MAFSFSITRDDVSPSLSKLASTAKNPTAIYRAMGTTFKSITEGNFNSVGSHLRPKPWPALRSGKPSRLKKSGTLSSSFHLDVTATVAKLSNPTIYAAVHQFGATIRPKNKKVLRFKTAEGAWVSSKGVKIPPRPFYPVDDSGRLTPAAEALITRAGERALARESGAQ